ncbi:MAG: XRE family transcriptional regulator [bacterium]|nr:XRE family transcriptional regulator [bacterium]
MISVPPTNRENLRVARENIGLSTLDASKGISASKKDLVSAWESGDASPSWPQIAKLSKLYNVSELIFFSPKVIRRYKSVPDFRVGKDSANDEKVQKLINLVITRQEWLERKLRSSGSAKNDLQGSGKKIESPKVLANFISAKLNIDLNAIKRIHGREKALDYLLQKAEDKGIFVGKTISYHRLEVADMRGLFVSNDYCPFIVLNRKDTLSAQIFSFIHELTHFFRKTDAISNSLNFRNTEKNLNPEEIFCNKVAANLLLPEQEFTREFYNKHDIEDISNIYKVSKLFIFYRLKDLGKIHKEIQDSLEKEIDAEMQENLLLKQEFEGRKKGGNYINNMKDSNGDLFNRVVYNTYLENKIGYVEASRLLRFAPNQV